MALIRTLGEHTPQIAASAFIADNATVVGQVTIGEEASIWYGAVLRADVGHIRIGARTNIQDLACIHMTGGLSHAEVGDDVTVGHGAIIHGAKVGNGALIGMGAILLDNAEIGEQAMIAAGAVVPPRAKIPPRTLVRGPAGKVVRELSEQECLEGAGGARIYRELAAQHRS